MGRRTARPGAAPWPAPPPPAELRRPTASGGTREQPTRPGRGWPSDRQTRTCVRYRQWIRVSRRRHRGLVPSAMMMVAMPTPAPVPLPDRPILVVDDDAKIVRLVRTYLEREGYGVVTAADGPAALDAIERFEPALVVLDLMLPELDGRAVIRAVRRDEQAAATPI